jgi:hypothetical protein
MKSVTAKLLDREGALVGFCEVPWNKTVREPGWKDNKAVPWIPEVISLRQEGRTFVRDSGAALGKTQDGKLMVGYVESTFAWADNFRLTEK